MLESYPSVTVRQQVEPLQVFTGLEAKNRYRIIDPDATAARRGLEAKPRPRRYASNVRLNRSRFASMSKMGRVGRPRSSTSATMHHGPSSRAA